MKLRGTPEEPGELLITGALLLSLLAKYSCWSQGKYHMLAGCKSII